MLQSKLFTKTRKEAPKDETATNAELLIRGGFIHKEFAGVYSYLPLGLRVLEKIEAIIRKEMNAIGGQELFLSALQDKKVWEKTGRWDDKEVDVWFKTELKNGTPLGLGFTHEEPLTQLMKNHIHSHRDLPQYVYQLQTKFRNETRAKSGLMRGREFLMKDLYSFSKSDAEHAAFYEKAKVAYKHIFEQAGIGSHTVLTYSSGGSFSEFSHEFQALTDSGEDTIYLCEKCNVAINEEIIEKQKVCPECGGKDLKKMSGVEVGNIFNLGTRFSDAFELHFVDEDGKKKPVVMGSYGIGPGRLMGTIVELCHDKAGIVWPKSVAPLDVHLIMVPSGNAEVKAVSDYVYKELSSAGVGVLYDDRDARAGEKFADADLIGIPARVVVSDKTVADKKVEMKERGQEKAKRVTFEELKKHLTQ
ncbi:prolyl-tRNA synthetase [Candidatus Parcubacteria bacterium]|nr:prolyl-tRNA synthetase [Candidatus Parcubacteria bacterium]